MEDRRMSRLEQKKEKLEKNVGRAVTTEIIAGGVALLSAGSALLCALGGSYGVIATDAKMADTASQIIETDEYQAYIREQKSNLLNKFDAGEIDYAEFKVAYEKLFTTEGVIEYSKTNKDPLLTERVKDYQEDRKEGQTMANTSLACLGGLVAGTTVAGVAEYVKRKSNAKLAEVVNELEDEVMSN